MAEVKFKKPCRDCPYRRKSTPGWLGGADPQWFIDAAEADFANYGPGDEGGGLSPCHETVDYSDPNWVEQLDETSACAGALIFQSNICKRPKHPKRAEAVDQVEQDHENVFSTHSEFIDHHTQEGSMRSWEYEKD